MKALLTAVIVVLLTTLTFGQQQKKETPKQIELRNEYQTLNQKQTELIVQKYNAELFLKGFEANMADLSKKMMEVQQKYTAEEKTEAAEGKK